MIEINESILKGKLVTDLTKPESIKVYKILKTNVPVEIIFNIKIFRKYTETRSEGYPGKTNGDGSYIL